MWSLIDYFYFLLPLIIGFGTGMICKTKSSAGNTVKFRPPSWVFSVVWTILYLFIGLSWLYSKCTSIYYIILMGILSLWLVAYSCMDNKKLALAVMFFALIFTLLTYTTAITQLSKTLLIPLFVWLLYALLISIFEIQNI